MGIRYSNLVYFDLTASCPCAASGRASAPEARATRRSSRVEGFPHVRIGCTSIDRVFGDDRHPPISRTQSRCNVVPGEATRKAATRQNLGLAAGVAHGTRTAG